MASINAKSPLRSARPLLIVTKLLSLSASILLLGAGWVTICYLKSEITPRPGYNSAAAGSVAPAAPAVQAAQADPSQAKQIPAPMRLVYSCAVDKQFYHCSTHLPDRCERTAMVEDAALQRGLKPCRVCLPQK